MHAPLSVIIAFQLLIVVLVPLAFGSILWQIGVNAVSLHALRVLVMPPLAFNAYLDIISLLPIPAPSAKLAVYSVILAWPVMLVKMGMWGPGITLMLITSTTVCLAPRTVWHVWPSIRQQDNSQLYAQNALLAILNSALEYALDVDRLPPLLVAWLVIKTAYVSLAY